MKTLIVIATLTATAIACPKGYEAFKGDCVADIQPETAPPIKPSDEKPPRSGYPAWQQADVKVIDEPSKVQEDTQMDQERVQADSQGKKAAGLR